MKRLSLIALFMLLVCLPLAAQQMSIVDFARLKGFKVQKDKQAAILDLATEEKGFTFLAGANQPVQAQEGDGVITLMLPHKTTRITVQHPTYGQLSWQVPGGKKLRKRSHYKATLLAMDPTRALKASHQWVIVHLNPQNTILQIDSLTLPVREEVIEMYLPVGEHKYKVEAPFFAPEEGSFTLADSVRTQLSVTLQPFYSYLTVYSEWEEPALYIDGSPVSWKDATSLRIAQGKHRVSCFKGKQCYLDTVWQVGRASKELLRLRKDDFALRPLKLEELASFNPDAPSADSDSLVMAPVKLSCKDPDAQILVDRECMGIGNWDGALPLGYHLLSARKDGQEGTPTKVILEDVFPREITLMAPGSGAGLVNIHSNVQGARIQVDGEDCGTTPQILQLEAGHNYEIVVYKPGYREKRIKLRPQGNRQVDVYMKLKKK